MSMVKLFDAMSICKKLFYDSIEIILYNVPIGLIKESSKTIRVWGLGRRCLLKGGEDFIIVGDFIEVHIILSIDFLRE